MGSGNNLLFVTHTKSWTLLRWCLESFRLEYTLNEGIPRQVLNSKRMMLTTLYYLVTRLFCKGVHGLLFRFVCFKFIFLKHFRSISKVFYSELFKIFVFYIPNFPTIWFFAIKKQHVGQNTLNGHNFDAYSLY